MKNRKNKEFKNYKPKSMSIIFPILLLVLMVSIVGANLLNFRQLSNAYVVSSKVREGNIQGDKIAEVLKMTDMSDSESLSQLYDSIYSLNSNMVGIRILKDGEDIFSQGKAFPHNVYYNATSTFDIFSSGNPVYFDTENNNVLYTGLDSDFGLNFSFEPFKEALTSYLKGNNENLNRIRGYQDLWYEYKYGEYTILYGQAVPVTDNDYQLFVITALEMHLTGFIIALIVLMIINRVIGSQKKLIRAYYADKETNGYNWYYFTNYVNKDLKRRKHSRTSGEKKAIIQLRIEKFSNFISCYGEKEGDKLVLDIYNALKQVTPKDTLIARYDKADFAIYATFSSQRRLNERVNELLETLKELRPSTSVIYKAGIYDFGYGEVYDATEAYSMAAMARQQAEKTYDSDIVFFTEDMKQVIQWEKKMENDLAQGIKNKEFSIYLQPKYSTTSEKIVAAEALVRWNHPKEGFLSPYKFIEIFEKTGQIIKLDDYMVSNVARIQSEIIKEGHTPLPISVNISRIHFAYSDLAEHICKLVDEYDVPHNLIEIELTESAFFDDKDGIIKISNRLREYGFEVSLDDFGSGYSSLNSLRSIPVDIVKLDGGFFRGQASDEKANIIVREIISLAKQLGKTVVAEGIEQREQVDFLKQSDCDMIQGYYFAKPMSLEEFHNNYY